MLGDRVSRQLAARCVSVTVRADWRVWCNVPPFAKLTISSAQRLLREWRPLLERQSKLDKCGLISRGGHSFPAAVATIMCPTVCEQMCIGFGNTAARAPCSEKMTDSRRRYKFSTYTRPRV